jgi:hypothetical protein
MKLSIYGANGRRKYLTQKETNSFIASAKHFDPMVYVFCWFIAATGCRISEALAINLDNIDFESQNVVIECLKKRGRLVFRSVPLSPDLLRALRGLPTALADNGAPQRLWPWSRMTGYRRICEVMRAAGIHGTHATPKGLRHAFGVSAIQAGVPLNLVQRWLGHADIKTTAIYTNAIGPEERAIAARMWSNQAARKAHPEACYTSASLGEDRSDTPEIDTETAKILSRQACRTPIPVTEMKCETSINRAFPAIKARLACTLIRYWLFCNRLFLDKPWAYPKLTRQMASMVLGLWLHPSLGFYHWHLRLFVSVLFAGYKLNEGLNECRKERFPRPIFRSAALWFTTHIRAFAQRSCDSRHIGIPPSSQPVMDRIRPARSACRIAAGRNGQTLTKSTSHSQARHGRIRWDGAD